MAECKAKMALIPARLWARVVAILWTVICLLILTHTLLQLGTSLRAISDALELQMYLMFAMAYPSGEHIYSAVYSVAFSRWRYSDEDFRTIVALWSILFVAGYCQWFVLPRALIALWHRSSQR